MSYGTNFFHLGLWLAGPLLETVILVRGLRAGWLHKYRFFSAYLFCVLIQDLLFFVVYFVRFRYYSPLYWCAELLSIALGLGVTYEIFQLVLGGYPGAGRMARNVLKIVILMTLFGNVAGTWEGHLLSRDAVIEIERNLRVMQALSLLVLATLLLYYRIPIRRNAKGLFVGYGMFVGSSVATLTLRSSLGESFQGVWVSMQPLCYVLALLIWCGFLWSYEPAPTECLCPQIEEDYRSLAVVTRKGVLQARRFLLRAVRP